MDFEGKDKGFFAFSFFPFASFAPSRDKLEAKCAAGADEKFSSSIAHW
jgi:hypothetical protein